MKKHLIVFAAVLVLASCQQKDLKSEIARMEAEKAEMLDAIEAKDKDIMAFMTSFAHVEENLREIREREMNIELARHADNISSEALEASIAEDVQVISRLLQENRKTMEKLSSRLSDARKENGRLNRLMVRLKEDLSQKIAEREQEITLLKDQLATAEVKVEGLSKALTRLREVGVAQDSVIHEQYEALNTAYYVIGSTKKLEQEQVISREGGVLGLGKTEKLSGNLDADKFTRIDIRHQIAFPLKAREVELVSSHPAHAYRIEKDEDSLKLVISNPQAFWESSRYMVVLTK